VPGVDTRAFLLPADFVRSPEARGSTFSADEAAAYTRWLARRHYENFHVATFLLPRRLRQDFYNVYAYCRWADDLGDEMGGRARSLELLAWWRAELDAMYAGRATHPVFVALMGTVRKYAIPRQPFADLIHAFVQDQTVNRYQD
jgi:phytoene/squalene synthetase